MLVDRHGNAITTASEVQLPPLRGGDWVPATVLGDVTERGHIYGVSRAVERRQARIAWHLNPMVEGIVNLLTSYVVGDDFTYGTMDDRRAYEALEELWAYNDLDLLGERIWLEYMIDGESAIVFGDDADADEPSQLELVDVDSSLELSVDTRNRVDGLTLHLANERVTYPRERLVWTAHQALWNDPRGWPPLMRALPACLSYIGLINARLRAQDLAGRINGVYKALYYSRDPKGYERFETKRSRFRNVPKSGAIMTLAVDAETGRGEEFEFLKAPHNAVDAATDGRLIRLLAAVALNIPPHWLGDAENTNRASATRMDGPPLIAMKRRQSTFRSILNRIYRRELIRRYGEDATFTVHYTEPSRDDPLTIRKRRRRVPAHRMEAPWVLPRLDDDTLAEVVSKVKIMDTKRLASKQTMQEMLGLDPATENERMAREQGPDVVKYRQTHTGFEQVDERDRQPVMQDEKEEEL